MLANVFTKSLRDRWTGTTVGMALIGLLLLGAMAAYQQFDTTLYTALPEAIRSVMGIPDGAEPAALAYSVSLSMMAGLTLSSLALSMGAGAVAGEERDGTIGVLLGNPRSRRQVLLSKVAGMVALIALGAVVVLVAAVVAPALLGVETGASDVVATTVHLFLNAVVWGTMAAAVGAATGNRSLASAVAGGLMVLSYFLTGLLPLVEATAGLAKAVPWYWFDGHDPLNGGLSVGYAGLQVGAVVTLLAAAWWGVEARDLRGASDAQGLIASLVDRVREDERAAALLDRLSGSTRVRSIWVKAASEGQALVVVTAIAMLTMMGLLMGPMYAALEDTLTSFSAQLPEALLAIAGGGDMSTPEGFYRLETFGLMAPIATALVASAVGVRALAGEERDRTMGLLLASPVSRRVVVLQKAVAMAVHAGIVGLATFVGVVGGSVIAGLGMSVPNIAAASLQATLLGTLFGAIALAIGAATGRVRTAVIGSAAVFLVAYAANAVLSVAESLEGWRRLSPFEWYLGGEPLVRGIEWSSVGLLVAATLLGVGAAVLLFERRDLRSNG